MIVRSLVTVGGRDESNGCLEIVQANKDTRTSLIVLFVRERKREREQYFKMASLGTGVIILIVLWVIALALLTLFTFVQSPIRFVGLIALVIAIIVTLVLALLPRGDSARDSSLNKTPSSNAALARIFVLTFLSVTFLLGLALVFLHEILPPIFAQPIRKRFVR